MNEDDIVDVTPQEPYSLEVTFRTGVKVRIDVKKRLWGKAFEPLLDPKVFACGRFDPAGGTIVWPNEADFSPEFLLEAALAASK